MIAEALIDRLVRDATGAELRAFASYLTAAAVSEPAQAPPKMASAGPWLTHVDGLSFLLREPSDL